MFKPSRFGSVYGRNSSLTLYCNLGQADMENLMVAGKLNILVVGDDVLRTNGEVGITHLSC